MKSIIHPTSDLSIFAQGNDWSNAETICGKRASDLCQLQYLGFDIPKGIVITTEGYTRFSSSDDRFSLSDDLFDEIYNGIHQLESITKKQYASDSLLLLSIAGNFPIPTVGFVGLNDYYVQLLEKQTNNKIFAYDSYRRLIAGYGIVACGIPESVFDDLYYDYKSSRNYKSLSDFTAFDFIQLVKMNKAIISQQGKRQFPQDPTDQLRDIILGIYQHYESDNVITFFQKTFTPMNGCSIIINSMVYGARSKKSCSIVVGTNDVAGGDYGFYGFYAIESFLDDVCENRKQTKQLDELQNDFPKQYKFITSKLDAITKCYKIPMEIKFVIENERLYAVGIKPERFGGLGHVTAEMEYVHMELLSKDDIIFNFQPYLLDCMFHDHLTGLPDSTFCSGTPGIHGTGTGKICLSTKKIENSKSNKKRNVILFKRNFYLSDIDLLPKIQAVVTSEGGDFSRGAYIARSLSTQGAFACNSLLIEEDKHVVSTPEMALREGKIVTVDFGDVFLGSLEKVPPDSILNADAAQFYEVAFNMTKDKFGVHMNVPGPSFIPMVHVLLADSISNLPFESLFINHGQPPDPLPEQTNNKSKSQTLNKNQTQNKNQAQNKNQTQNKSQTQPIPKNIEQPAPFNEGGPDMTLADYFLEAMREDKDIPSQLATNMAAHLTNAFIAADKVPVTVQLFDLPLTSMFQNKAKLEEELKSLFQKRDMLDDTHKRLNELRAKRAADKKAREEEEERKAQEEREKAEKNKGKNNRKTAQPPSKPKPKVPEKFYEEEDFELPHPNVEADMRERINKIQNIMGLRINTIHLSYLYPRIFAIQIRIIINAAKAAKENGVEPIPKILIPFANEDKEMLKLTNYINGISKEAGLKTDIGCIGMSPSNITVASKYVNFIMIYPDKMFQLATPDAPSYIDNSLWYQSQNAYSRDLLRECINCSKKKKKQLPVIVSADFFQTRQSVEELVQMGVKAIATNPLGIVIARFCAAQALISLKPPADEDDDEELNEE
ncbi:hypothetical protein M9Y10_039098 [Tritrichomonas musculus]|uniref:PEP-utilising enzyme mobile domain-containing protein n=1 Tax=Tritrichomonas musculus TaxID=1915356 RepID=A0ABR2KA87_9EUKA